MGSCSIARFDILMANVPCEYIIILCYIILYHIISYYIILYYIILYYIIV